MDDQLPHPHWDNATKRIFGFFVAKKLLLVPGIRPLPMVKLDLGMVIQVGLEIEPRIIEVLPAALLHFPRTFLNSDKMPEKLVQVLDAIRKNRDSGPDLAGISFQAMKRWANRELRDARAIPIDRKRVMVSFRLSPIALKKVNELSLQRLQSKTDVLEDLILKA